MGAQRKLRIFHHCALYRVDAARPRLGQALRTAPVARQNVFDISQTEGKELPALTEVQGDVSGYRERLVKIVKAHWARRTG